MVSLTGLMSCFPLKWNKSDLEGEGVHPDDLSERGVEIKPNLCPYWPEMIIQITYIGPNNPPATFDGSNIPIILFAY